MPNAIITGANRGIGLEFCRALTERGYHVTALCRQSSEALEGLPVEVHTNFDVTDTDAIQTFASNVAPGSIDLLINNAAIMQSVSLDHMDLDAVRRQLEVNAIGYD
jgi:NAD(P)-dependent dehydrogenase (short-subunit alcohol dehydrogenase family)